MLLAITTTLPSLQYSGTHLISSSYILKISDSSIRVKSMEKCLAKNEFLINKLINSDKLIIYKATVVLTYNTINKRNLVELIILFPKTIVVIDLNFITTISLTQNNTSNLL